MFVLIIAPGICKVKVCLKSVAGKGVVCYTIANYFCKDMRNTRGRNGFGNSLYRHSPGGHEDRFADCAEMEVPESGGKVRSALWRLYAWI